MNSMASERCIHSWPALMHSTTRTVLSNEQSTNQRIKPVLGGQQRARAPTQKPVVWGTVDAGKV